MDDSAAPPANARDRLKVEAETNRLLLVGGVTTVSDVVRWADEKIEAAALPSTDIIEVSLSGARGVGALVTTLGQIRGASDAESVSRRVFAAMDALLTRDAASLSRVVTLLEHMAVEGIAPSKGARDEMYGFDAMLWCDEAQRYELSASVLPEVLAFLRRHK